MDKILGIIGGVSSVVGSVLSFKWLRKLLKIKNVVWGAIKEGKDVLDEGMDIIPVANEFIRQIKLVKFGDTSKKNVEAMERALRVATKLAKEAQEAGKELRDLKQVFADAKELF